MEKYRRAATMNTSTLLLYVSSAEMVEGSLTNQVFFVLMNFSAKT